MSFDVSTTDLNGLNLIEASAGTGKTYTLAELYLRLVVEKQLNVDQILVVTFTNAATEELRDRLRQKLVDARDEVDLSDVGNTGLFRRLNLAIQSFDEAAIYTIHGFCQRVLADFAFESGLPFELELIGDDVELLQAATDDFWRRHVVTAEADFTAYLQSKKQSPETLLQSIRPLLGKPYLTPPELPSFDIDASQTLLNKQFDAVKALWMAEQDDIIATLTNKDLLNGNKYRTASVERWLMSMMALCEQDTLPQSLFKDFDRFTPTKLEDALKKDQVLPELQFWSACEQLLEQHEYLGTLRGLQLQQLRLALLDYLQTTLPEVKKQQQVQSYDDLLLNLDAALSGEQSEDLIAQLREQYQAALIDEFQDTDPVQYASFSRIYAQTGLPTFFVGDPKQAIYSFRGADIFTYLNAKQAAEHEHTLGKNWRSHPRLVNAVNAIFQRVDSPFMYEGIPFVAVEAAREDESVLQVEGKALPPVEFVWLGDEKPLDKKTMNAAASADTADQIADLLNQSQQGQAVLVEDESRELTGGDIAVLVRNHRQATAIQEALGVRGINSVQQGRDNVFASAEAIVMLRLLMAVYTPNNDNTLSALLTTPLFECSPLELYEAQQDETRWLAYIDLMHQLHDIWQQQGFMALFRQLLSQNKVEQTVLGQVGGERQMTNLLHLAELIQDYVSRQHAHLEATIQWLNRQMQSANTDQDSAQVRLESDEQLVKIITIHKSKGLEYPVVFCPFLWDVNQQNTQSNVLTYHDAEAGHVAKVAMAEPALSQAREAVELESQAEDLRLLYVALTRARERCVIFWGNAKGYEKSALYQLLHPTQTEGPSAVADLQNMAETQPNLFAVRHWQDTAPNLLDGSQQQAATLHAREFNGQIHTPWRIGSFSALTAGHDAELPDYDATAQQQDESDELERQPSLDRFSFHKGAQAGTCLHSIFELWDFHDAAALEALVAKQLALYGFEEKWQPVVTTWMQEVVETPLTSDGTALAQLSPQQRLDEMGFYFPALMTAADVKHTLLPLLDKDSVLYRVVESLSFYDLSGFMKGFIDLVFEHNGQYFVVDYKSNYLGQQPKHYQSASLDQAMIQHDYPLQYLIYSLALHRYLKLRLPDYDPVTHLGGVAYLFIRGMKPEWGSAGVFFEHVPVPALLALDKLIAGVSDE